MVSYPDMELHGNDMSAHRRRMLRDLELFLGVGLSDGVEAHDKPTDETSPAHPSRVDRPVYSSQPTEARPC